MRRRKTAKRRRKNQTPAADDGGPAHRDPQICARLRDIEKELGRLRGRRRKLRAQMKREKAELKKGQDQLLEIHTRHDHFKTDSYSNVLYRQDVQYVCKEITATAGLNTTNYERAVSQMEVGREKCMRAVEILYDLKFVANDKKYQVLRLETMVQASQAELQSLDDEEGCLLQFKNALEGKGES